MKQLLLKTTLLLFISTIISCENFDREFESEPLIGVWFLVKKTADKTNIPIDSCMSKTTIEFKSNKRYTEIVFYKDSIGKCKFYEDFGKWNKFNGKYDIDNLTIIDQKLKIEIIGNRLIYSYQAWHDPFGNFTTYLYKISCCG
ncbi:lipocalin-like domain-containing protein [Polaribacter glomeratus]|uniref:Lipocalin-like domain-containing protein n=1 Tax=Polaribacter glomeratus TaxID=102 RepID=A0A2S7WGC8_9FLAO|nr:lipocalin family protein [Polaribacter glomeratus]PQJ76679.1 hypothetical protein BTO16_12395 [Polaribacter glomeratus]TXD67481.1 lipocalin family protein [Polaribacter glomeratus]